jgi:hypothetical protein
MNIERDMWHKDKKWCCFSLYKSDIDKIAEGLKVVIPESKYEELVERFKSSIDYDWDFVMTCIIIEILGDENATKSV